MKHPRDWSSADWAVCWLWFYRFAMFWLSASVGAMIGFAIRGRWWLASMMFAISWGFLFAAWTSYRDRTHALERLLADSRVTLEQLRRRPVVKHTPLTDLGGTRIVGCSCGLFRSIQGDSDTEYAHHVAQYAYNVTRGS